MYLSHDKQKQVFPTEWNFGRLVGQIVRDSVRRIMFQGFEHKVTVLSNWFRHDLSTAPLTRMHSSRMHAMHAPTMHAPCPPPHTTHPQSTPTVRPLQWPSLLPCIPSCHACPLPHMPPSAMPRILYMLQTPWPCTPTCHACSLPCMLPLLCTPAMHCPLSCMPPFAMHAPTMHAP